MNAKRQSAPNAPADVIYKCAKFKKKNIIYLKASSLSLMYLD